MAGCFILLFALKGQDVIGGFVGRRLIQGLESL